MCTDLTNYVIKQHKRNPYKPWRCDSCRDEYCKQCDKFFSEKNYPIICCDKCSFWFHSNPSCCNLTETEFKFLSENRDAKWTCPPCLRKLCVSCNLSTHNKPKVNCINCNQLYHKICAKLPNSSKYDTSNWLCKHCRPVIFPFHNVDYKTLIKFSTKNEKYSLDNMSKGASSFSRKCSICSKNLSKNNPGIPCYSCNSKVHSKCSGIADCKNNFHLYKGNWQCKNCYKDKFPFSDLDNKSFIELAATNRPPIKNREYPIDEKLKLLLSQTHVSNWYAHNSPNKWDHPDKSNVKPNFAYYDIPDFNKCRHTWNQQNSLSVFHTNISSITANSDKLKELLVDLSWNFDIIALSETWNDEKTDDNFTPPSIPGYAPYDGTTGSSLKGGCGFFVKSNMTTIPRKDLEFKIKVFDSQTESCWIEIVNAKGPNTVIGFL